MDQEHPSAHRSFPDVKASLLGQRPDFAPFLDRVADPDAQDILVVPLSELDIRLGSNPLTSLPSGLVDSMGTHTARKLGSILLDPGRDPQVNTKKALGFLRAQSMLGRAHRQMGELACSADLSLSQYDQMARLVRRVAYAQNALEGVVGGSEVWGKIKNEISSAQVELFGKSAPEAVGIVEDAFGGKQVDKKKLRQAGNLLHHYAQLNEQRAGSPYFLGTLQGKAAKEAALTVHMALVKNDLLGYHGDDPVKTAEDTVWHARRAIEKLYLHPGETKEVAKQLKALGDVYVTRTAHLTPEQVMEFRPADTAGLVSMREIDELLLEMMEQQADKGEYSSITERLISTYGLLACFHESTGDFPAALSDYRNVCELAQDLDRIPPEETMDGLVRALEQRSTGLPREERLYVWGMNIQELLQPSSAYNFIQYKNEHLMLAAEIGRLEVNLKSGEYQEREEYARIVRSILFAVEEPGEASVGILERIADGTSQVEDSEMKRLHQIARFFINGWKEHSSSGHNDDPLRHYRAMKLYESNAAANRLREEGQESVASQLTTDQIAAGIIVSEPETWMTGQAAVILPKPTQSMPAGDVRLQIDGTVAERLKLPSDPALTEFMSEVRGYALADDVPVQVAEGTAVVPLVIGPQDWIAQPKFHISIRTAGAALTMVLKEGKIAGSFITTERNPQIDISEILSGSDESRLWEPQSPSGMSVDERKTHGGNLVGTIQLISLPITIGSRDDRGEGGESGIVPIPPGGVELLRKAGDYPESPDTDTLLIWRGIIAAMMARVREGSYTGPDLTMRNTMDVSPATRLDFGGYSPNEPYASQLFYGNTRSWKPDASNLFRNWTGAQLQPVKQPKVPSRKKTMFTPARGAGRYERVAIGTSQTSGSRYSTFTGEMARNPRKPVSVVRFSIIGVSSLDHPRQELTA